MPRDLRNQIIVITGASSGIGAATARQCFEAGMIVVAAARRIDRLHELVAPMGDRGLAIACDVDRDEDVAHLFAQAGERFGRMDAVFANAGFGLNQPIEQTSDAQARALFETNFFGTLRCIRVALPALLASRGHLLICSSAASEIGLAGYGVYAATKAAQKSIAQALRAELRDRNVHVTTIHPVGTRTEFFEIVARAAGRNADGSTNTPKLLEQSAEQVARAVVKTLRRPRSEVWPMPLARYALAGMNMFPRLGAWAMRHQARRTESRRM